MIPDHYNTIEKSSVAEFKDKGSKFIAYAFPIKEVNDFKEKLAGIKKEHPKATHHCFAYRLGTDGVNWRASDDGEPSGTAGRPILGQIDSRELTNVLILVVRYFGGSLLGVPGLINAYRTAAALALQLTPVIPKPILVHYRLEFDHTQTHAVMRVLKQFDCVILHQEMQLFCVISAGIARNRLTQVLDQLNQLRGVELVKC